MEGPETGQNAREFMKTEAMPGRRGSCPQPGTQNRLSSVMR